MKLEKWSTDLHALDLATVAGDGGDVRVGFAGGREDWGGLKAGERSHHSSLSRADPVNASHSSS